MSEVPQPKPSLIDNLSGSLDIMLGRENGMAKIDHSAAGFWLSFWGIVLMALIDTSALSMIYDVIAEAKEDRGYSKPSYIFLRLLIALLGYGASFVALYLLCRTSDEQSRFPDAIIVNNWSAAILSFAFLPLIWMSTLAAPVSTSDGPPGAFVLLVLVSWAIITIAGIRILKTSLKISVAKAAIYFAASSAVSILLNEGFQSLVGL